MNISFNIFLVELSFFKLYKQEIPTDKSLGISVQIGSGVVRGGPKVRFHEDSTRGFHQGSIGISTRV